MENLGFLAALGAALAWGSYAVPFKISKSGNLIQFQALMGLGILFSGTVFSLFLGYPLTLNTYGIISGALWASANIISLMAVLNLGLSKAMPVSQFAGLVAVLWGIFYFKEITKTAHKMQVVAGAVILLIGIVILGSA